MTGTAGLIAVDKVGNKIRFYDPQTLREIKQFDAPEPCAHEMAISHDHKTAFVPLYGDGIYGGNKTPNNKILIVDLVKQQLAGVIPLGEYVAPHGIVATREGKLWVVCDIPGKLLLPSRPGEPHSRSGLRLSGERPAYRRADAGRAQALRVAQGRRACGLRCGAAKVRGRSHTDGARSQAEMAAVVKALRRRAMASVCWRSTMSGTICALSILRTDREIDRVPLDGSPFSNIKRSRLAKLMFSPDGKHLVVTTYASGLAWLIDAADLRRQTRVPVAKGPQGIAFAPDGKSALVSSHDSGLLTRIALADGCALAAYDGGAGRDEEVLALLLTLSHLTHTWRRQCSQRLLRLPEALPVRSYALQTGGHKMTTRRTFIQGAIAATAASTFSSVAFAQQGYPDRPIHIVVGFAAGSGADILCRFYGNKLAELSGQTVIIENRPGAVSVIAANVVAKSKPDGYTMLFSGNSIMVGGKYLVKDLPFDPVKEFISAGAFLETPFVIAVGVSNRRPRR